MAKKKKKYAKSPGDVKLPTAIKIDGVYPRPRPGAEDKPLSRVKTVALKFTEEQFLHMVASGMALITSGKVDRHLVLTGFREVEGIPSGQAHSISVLADPGFPVEEEVDES